MNKIPFIILVLIFSIMTTVMVIFLSGDMTKYEYKVKIEKCSGPTDTVTFVTKGKGEHIDTYREAVPVLYIGNKKFINICSYEILSKKEIK